MVHRDQPRGGTPEQKTNKRSVWGCGVAITEDSVFTPEGSFLVTDGVRISEQGTRGFDLCRDDIVATEKLLGSGASSDVYKAYLASDPSTPVALKVVSTEYARQIRDELKAFIHLQNCPHMLRCYGAYKDSGDIVIALEYAPFSVDKVLTQLGGPLPVAFVQEIAREALEGLGSLESLEIIHRDISPSNLLLDRSGCVKIADFGVSKIDSSAQSYVGCRQYMPLERLLGNSYGPNTDVWSLGLVLLQCLLGFNPILGSDPSAKDRTYFSVMVSKSNPILEYRKQLQDSYHDISLFLDLLELMLEMDNRQRSGASALLGHEFWRHFSSTEGSWGSWLEELFGEGWSPRCNSEPTRQGFYRFTQSKQRSGGPLEGMEPLVSR